MIFINIYNKIDEFTEIIEILQENHNNNIFPISSVMELSTMIEMVLNSIKCRHKHLYLSRQNFTSEKVRTLITLLNKKYPTLKTLDLSHNQIFVIFYNYY